MLGTGTMPLPAKAQGCTTIGTPGACQKLHGLADVPDACRYYLLIGLTVAPLLAVGNAYGAGLTDWNMASLYTKVSAAHKRLPCLVLSTMLVDTWCCLHSQAPRNAGAEKAHMRPTGMRPGTLAMCAAGHLLDRSVGGRGTRRRGRCPDRC